MGVRSPEPNEPNGLLAALVPFGVLRQPEVSVTTGLWWLLGLEGASSAARLERVTRGVVHEAFADLVRHIQAGIRS